MKGLILSLVMLVLVLGMENAQAFTVQRQKVCRVEYTPSAVQGDYLAKSETVSGCINQGIAQRNLANSLYRVCRGRPDSYIVGGTITIREYFLRGSVVMAIDTGILQSLDFDTTCQFHRVAR